MFGSIMGDLEDDPIFGHQMRSMRQMNSMMNSMFQDPFGGMFSPFDAMQQHVGQSALTGAMVHHQQQQQQHQQQLQHHHHHQLQHQQQMQQHHRAAAAAAAMMPFGFSGMPNINSMLSGQMPGGSTSYSSSQVVSMTRGPDGRPQVYKATSSTKTGPGGLKETQKTVQDSRSGVKKMAIGHHIGERAHVIEREKNYNTGHEEERQDFINLEEEEADDFNREFTHRSRSMMGINGARGAQQRDVTTAAIMPAPEHANGGSSSNSSPPLAIMPPTNSSSTLPSLQVNGDTNSSAARRSPYAGNKRHIPVASPRRPLRTPAASPLTTSIHPHPYIAPSTATGASRRHNRSMKGAPVPHGHQQSQPSPPLSQHSMQQQHQAATPQPPHLQHQQHHNHQQQQQHHQQQQQQQQAPPPHHPSLNLHYQQPHPHLQQQQQLQAPLQQQQRQYQSPSGGPK